ncbi:MAG: hypothetical protein LBS74_08040 [Oscillospiraceae bacterium]|nr:hypothetical protein [Oscillospiraceae bacterium]
MNRNEKFAKKADALFSKSVRFSELKAEKKLEKAIGFYSKAFEKPLNGSAYSAEAYKALGKLKLALGKPQEAKSCFYNAVQAYAGNKDKKNIAIASVLLARQETDLDAKRINYSRAANIFKYIAEELNSQERLFYYEALGAVKAL